jgi:hypothetical protein
MVYGAWKLLLGFRVCSTIKLKGIGGQTRVWYSKGRCGVHVPLPIHVGRSLLWHPKIRSRTLDGGSAVEVIHRLGRGVQHCSVAHRWTTCMWICLSKINSISRRRRINISITMFFPSRSSINLRSSSLILLACLSNTKLIID